MRWQNPSARIVDLRAPFSRALVLALLLSPGLASAQDDTEPPAEEAAPPPCSAPEFSQFDFWVGEWDITFEGGTGSNTITREYDGCVIRERFETATFKGTSYSSWSTKLGKWQQTWVDNAGSYMDFEGGMVGDRMILSREVPESDQATHQRMVFYDITEDSLNWDWEKSTDGGESWTLSWRLHYKKRT